MALRDLIALTLEREAYKALAFTGWNMSLQPDDPEFTTVYVRQFWGYAERDTRPTRRKRRLHPGVGVSCCHCVPDCRAVGRYVPGG